jgi:hypothetical protein
VHLIQLAIVASEINLNPTRVLGRCRYQQSAPSWTSSHLHHEETGEFRSIQVFDFVKHAPDHDTVLKRYETSLDAMATTRRPYTR